MTHLTYDTLNIYLDGKLDPAGRADADEHLTKCAECRERLAGLRSLFVALDALPPERIPVDLTERVMRRVAPARRWPTPVAAAILGAEFVLSALALAWLGPSLLGQVAPSLTLAPQLPSLTTPTLEGLPAQLAALAEDAWASLAETLSANSGLLSGVQPVVWTVIILAAGALWLAGNGLLLGSARGTRGTSREVA